MSRSALSSAALSLVLLASTAALAAADPPGEGRRGGRGEWRGEPGDRAPRAEARADRGGPPPVAAHEPGRGQRSWADRPRFEAQGEARASRPDRGDRYGLEDGDRSGRWTDRGRDQRGRDHVAPHEGWRGDDHRGRGRDDDRDHARRGDEGRSRDHRWRDDGDRRDVWRDDGRRRHAGREDHRWRSAPGYGRDLRARDHGRHWYEPHRFHRHYRAHTRYRASTYIFPHGWYARSWRFGEILPYGWYGASYYLDWRAYDLPYPPIGCEWIRVGRDAILVDVWTGEVLSVWYDLFW